MGGAAAPPAARRSTGVLPILDWLPRYDRSWLRSDIIAGIAVTAMIVPKNLGYAEIAGVPVQNGLYAAAAGALIYALFCTSRHISTGPSSSLAAVAGGAVIVAGAAVDVVIGELPKLTGTSADGESAWAELASWIGSLGDAHWTTVLVGVV